MDEIRKAEQITLNKRKVPVVNAGGFGSTVALYLTAAGVGTNWTGGSRCRLVA